MVSFESQTAASLARIPEAGDALSLEGIASRAWRQKRAKDLPLQGRGRTQSMWNP